MDALWRLVERKIEAGQKDGLFDNLTGAGEPLRLEDESHIPPELRMSYKILKNANLLPPRMELRKELLRLEDLLACCRDEKDAAAIRQRLTLKRLQMDIMLEKEGKVLSPAYMDRVNARLG